MRYVISILGCLWALASAAQVPDSLTIIPDGDRVRVVVILVTPEGERIIREKAPTDSLTAARQLYQYIYDNELTQVSGVRQLKEQSQLTKIYVDVNSALQQLTGQGYVDLARQFLKENFVGRWVATLSGQSIYLDIRDDNTAVQIDQEGAEVGGGYSGTWRPITEHSFQLVGVLPVAILPAGERIISIRNGSSKFFALNSSIEFEKID